MGRFTYYCPAALGAGLTLTLAKTIAEAAPAMLRDSPWVWVGLSALAAGVICQVLMVSAQGVLAQVLPVPGGRSIRGRAAVGGGFLLGSGVLCAPVAALLYSEGFGGAAWIVAGVGLAALLTFTALYIWNLPVARRDFSDDAEPA